MDNQQVGVDAVWNNSNFNKGQAEYTSKLQMALGATQEIAAKAEDAGAKGGIAGGLMQVFGGAASAATGNLLGLAVAAGGFMEIGRSLITGFGDLISSVQQFGSEALLAGSRVQQLSYIAQILGQRQGYTNEQVNSFVDQIRAQGISMDVANQLVAQFARYNLDMADAVKLAAVAQDAATLSNEGSSEALEGLLHGITTLNVRVLRTHGILTNLNDAYAAYAQEIGKTVDALTTEEKEQAALNAVLREGERIQGAYAISMETAGKQMGTLKSRLIPDLIASLGAPFQQAFFNVISGINSFVKGITAAITEGGALYPILVQLGAVAELITEPIRDIGKAFEEGAAGPLQNFASQIAQTAQNMLSWGFNLVINLATGIIDGASTALVSAINYVSNILSFWFAPGSPPNVAPNIDVWGAETLEEWLHGFDQADFSILKDIQGTLKTAISGLISAGEIGKEAGAEMYLNLSAGLTEALSSGQLSQDLLDQITAAGGAYGDELAELVQKQFELAESAKAVERAEKALADAKKRESAAGAAVNKGLVEYNQMLRSGASKEALDAKLKEINAGKVAQQQAAEDIDSAEVALELEKEKQKAMAAQVKLLEDLVAAMADFAKAQEDTMPTTGTTPSTGGVGAGGGGGVGGGGLPETPTGEGENPMGGVLDSMKEAITQAVADMKQKLSDAWETIKNTVAQKWQEAMDKIRTAFEGSGLSEKWEKIKEAAGVAWEWIKTEVSEVITYISDWWEKNGEGIITFFQFLWDSIVAIIQWAAPFIGLIIKNAWNVIITVVRVVWETVKAIFKIALNAIGTTINFWVKIFQGDWEGAWQVIVDYVTNLWTILVDWLEGVWSALVDFFKNFLQMFVDVWGPVWEWIKNIVVTVWTAIVDWVQGAVQSILDWIVGIGESISEAWNNLWTGIQTKIQEIWQSIVDWLLEKLRGLFESMGLDFDDMVAKWTQIWDDIKLIVETVWNRIVEWVTEKVEAVRDFIEEVVSGIKDWWDETWTAIKDKVGEIWDKIQSAVEAAVTWVSDKIHAVIDPIVDWWETTWNSIKDKVSEIWDSIKTAIGTKVEEIKTAVEEFVQGIIDKITGAVQSAWDAGVDFITGLKDGILQAIGNVISEITGAVQGIIDTILDLLGIASPSKVMKAIGKLTMKGLELGITANAFLPEKAMAKAAINMIAPAAQPITMGTTTNYYQPNINLNTVVNGGLGAAQLESLIIRTVRKGMTR